VTLRVVEPFKYGGQLLKAGDPVEMPAKDAKLYKHLGKVTAAPARKARRKKPA
jgi:hypothetical protein